MFSQNNYRLYIHPVNKDNLLPGNTSNSIHSLNLQSTFPNRAKCTEYIFNLPELLATKGYPAASVDSLYHDSSSTHIYLYLGEQYQWIEINTGSIDKKLLSHIGWNESFQNTMDFARLQAGQQKILDYYEIRGYPFAAIKMDSIIIAGNKIKARLNIDKGPLYHIDSIRVYGKVKIKNIFLQL